MYTRTNTQPFAYTLPDWKQKVKRRKTNWIDHILHRNCLLKHIIEGKIDGRIEVKGTKGTRNKELLDNLNEKRK
jgi:hypothetical protein